MFIPWPAYIWLIFSSVAVAYDFLYIQLRPLTFVDQIHQWKFEPYQVYQFFDPLKINMEDRFVVIQSWMNAIEVCLILLTIIVSLIPRRKVKFACAVMIIVLQSMVFWKTVIYLWYDRYFITVLVERLYSIAVVFYYFTIGPFIIFPLLTIYYIGKRMLKAIVGEEKRKQE